MQKERNTKTVESISKLPKVSAGERAKCLSVYTDNDGNKAVIPKGWTVSGVPRENLIWGKDMGMVIYKIPKKKISGIDWKNNKDVNRIMETYDQLVWIPVDMLSATSTLDGRNFNEKFGRMNYQNEKFSESKYNEPLVGKLAKMKKSIEIYGGYYVTRYMISRDEYTGELRTIKGKYPLTNICFNNAKELLKSMAKGKGTSICIPYGANYDTELKWIEESGTLPREAITRDSTGVGNYYHNENYPNSIVKTGEDGCVNNIYGIAGNVSKITQEQFKFSYDDDNNPTRVVRDGNYRCDGERFSVVHRGRHSPDKAVNVFGFRATLYIKLP